jgi:3',5'-cyclic AMP phosphodiesterase CpdA
MKKTTVLRIASAAMLLAAQFPAAGATDRLIAPIDGTFADIPDGAELLFVVGGDNRPTGRDAPLPRVTKTIFSEIGLIRPDFIVWSGDAVYGYGDTEPQLSVEYERFASVVRAAGAPLFNAPGNHEIHHREGEPCEDRASEREFARRFGNLYGSFDAAGAHFIALDTSQVCSEDRLDPAQREWLSSDLEAHKNARAIFVFTHSVLFTSPTIDPGSAKPEIRDKTALIALFRRYPVRAVFSGHEHLYWHEAHDGIDYFISGGAGAPLYASPDRGGFSHYVVVRLTGSTARYDLIEPGHLYVETGSNLEGEKTTWIVNGNDVDIALRGVSLEAPASLGPCRALVAESHLKKSDGTPVPVPIAATGCAVENGKRRVKLALTAPRGTSVPIALRPRRGHS